MLATPEGTRRYAARHAHAEASHWRSLDGLAVGSIGLGTYLGEEDAASDAAYAAAARRALGLGCNLLDTAINYRCQRSERALGKALAEAFAAKEAAREEVVVCTKGGYLPFDEEVPRDPERAWHETYLKTGILAPADLVGGVHAMSPRYLRDQLARSLRNLGLDAVDVYYVHNPEHQLSELKRDEFDARIRDAFGALEQACEERKVGRYGVATWDGLRAPPEAEEHLSLERLVALAAEGRAAAGLQGPSRFRVVQAPLNLAMPEAYLAPTQGMGSKRVPLLEAAHALGIGVVGSASLMQGRLTRGLPGYVGGVLGLERDAHRALQFARSCPGLTVSLAGMGQARHAEENLALAGRRPAEPEDLRLLFDAAARGPKTPGK